MGILFNSELAFSYSVPNFKVFVSSATCDLSVVGGESNGENVSSVTDESSACDSFFEVPESESSVPRSRQSVSAVLREL
jgi:hypothetical protein